MILQLEDLVEAYTINKNGIFIKVLEWNKDVIDVLKDVFERDSHEIEFKQEFYFIQVEDMELAKKKFNKIKTLHVDYTWTALIMKGKIIETYSY
ncbi:hypothetical protein CHH83_02395 [Bacillus sp. 7586-K]|nr:hypothetical protein CHH83_02395 [Bacillus sp. 7586-K]